MREWARVPLGLLVVQVISAGLQILSRVIFVKGSFVYAIVVYRNVLAALCLIPFALYFERGALKKLGFQPLLWFFVTAAIGISIGMGLLYYGLTYTNATYATNFQNLVPVATFILSTLLRIEKLGIKRRAGKIKVLGVVICLGGALTLVLYKGKSFHFTHRVPLMQPHHQINDMFRGTIFLVVSCLCTALWYILQLKIFNVFPFKYWATVLTCTIATVQASAIGVFINRKPQDWRLDWNLQLLTIAYAGILGTATSFVFMAWAISKKGPTYAAMFNPLSLVLVAITEVLFLGGETSVGSLLGMSLIIVGMYAFLWGKNKGIKATTLPVMENGSANGGDDGDRGEVEEVPPSESK